MKRRTKIILWIYVIGVVLVEIHNLRTGYVMGGLGLSYSSGPSQFIFWLAVSLLIAATWPVWGMMVILSLFGLKIYF